MAPIGRLISQSISQSMFCSSSACCGSSEAEERLDRPRLPYTPSGAKTSTQEPEQAEDLQEPWLPTVEAAEEQASLRHVAFREEPKPAVTFNVSVENKDKKEVGLACDRVKCDHLFIDDVSGLIQAYNRTASIHNVVKKSDFLMSVNGKRSDSLDMAQELDRNPEYLDLEFRRSTEFPMVISDTKKKLGVELSYSKASMSLFIREIAAEGIAADHNQRHPDKAVREGDRIIAVNGITGSALQLLDTYKSCNDAIMTICRPLD